MVQFRFAPQMWAARPHLGSIFKKLLHRKTFWLPAARCLQPRLSYFDVMFRVKHSEIAPRETTRNRFGKAGDIPSLPWESQLPLKPCISLQPSDYEGNCDSISIFLRFPLRFIKTFVKEGSLPSLTIHLAELSQLDRSSPTA